MIGTSVVVAVAVVPAWRTLMHDLHADPMRTAVYSADRSVSAER